MGIIIGFGILLTVVSLVGFTLFMKRVYVDLKEQHQAMDVWSNFFSKYMDYVDEINDISVASEYVNYLSQLNMSINGIGSCVKFSQEVGDYEMEIYNKYHKHIPSLVKQTRNDRLGQVLHT